VSANTSIALVCAAPIASLSWVKENISRYSQLIAVDGGANHCHQMGLTPHLLLGDLDSIDPRILTAFDSVPKERYPSHKDETDLELAIEHVLRPETEKITAFGALGGRTDHIMGNVILLSRYPGKVFLETETELLFVIKERVELKTRAGQIISLVPLNGPAQGISTEGLKWPLNKGYLDKQFIGLCNEATASTVTISVEQGDLLCCILKAESP
jgi:thiamine pyrophosphokinase